MSNLMGPSPGDQDVEGKSFRKPVSPELDLRPGVGNAVATADAEEHGGLAQQRFETLGRDLERDIMTSVREAINVEIVAVSQAGRADTVARLSADTVVRLRKHVLQETGIADAGMHSIEEPALGYHCTQAEAGIPDGQTTQLMQVVDQWGTLRAYAGQNLRVADEALDKSGILPEIGILDESTLQLAQPVELQDAEVAGADQGLAGIADQNLPSALTLTVRHALSSEILVNVQASPNCKVRRLHEAVLGEIPGVVAALHLVFRSRVLEPMTTIAEAGLMDGDSVFLVQGPLRCLTTSADGTVRVWQLCGGDCQESMLVEPAGPMLTSALSSDGARLLTVASNGRGELWSTGTGARLCVLDGLAMTGEFSPDGRWIAGASDGEAVRVWCPRTGRCLRVLHGHMDDVKSASFSPDGRHIVTASCDGTACIWVPDTGERTHSLLGHTSMVRSAAFSRNSQLVITTSVDGTARVWSVASGACLHVLKGHTTVLSCASFSPTMNKVLTASFDGTVKVWEATSGECVFTLPTENVVNMATYSPDGSTVLIVSSSRYIRLFDASSGHLLLTLSGHEDWVRAASFSSDGMFIASASYDSTVRIWSAATGACLQILTGHARAVLAVGITN